MGNIKYFREILLDKNILIEIYKEVISEDFKFKNFYEKRSNCIISGYDKELFNEEFIKSNMENYQLLISICFNLLARFGVFIVDPIKGFCKLNDANIILSYKGETDRIFNNFMSNIDEEKFKLVSKIFFMLSFLGFRNLIKSITNQYIIIYNTINFPEKNKNLIETYLYNSRIRLSKSEHSRFNETKMIIEYDSRILNKNYNENDYIINHYYVGNKKIELDEYGILKSKDNISYIKDNS